MNLERYFDRENARAAARSGAPCPTCFAAQGVDCRSTMCGLQISGVHRARYAAAAIDVSIDVYAEYDDPPRGLVRAGLAQSAIRECDLLVGEGLVARRNALLAVVPVEFRNGREEVAP